jgi:hypothetical protein
MATKIATATYEVSTTETLTIRASGPFDPVVSLDGTRLTVRAGASFPITPRMLNGSGSHHFLFFTLIYPPGDPLATYRIEVGDDGGVIDTIAAPPPADGDTRKIECEILVEIV